MSLSRAVLLLIGLPFLAGADKCGIDSDKVTVRTINRYSSPAYIMGPGEGEHEGTLLEPDESRTLEVVFEPGEDVTFRATSPTGGFAIATWLFADAIQRYDVDDMEVVAEESVVLNPSFTLGCNNVQFTMCTAIE